MEVVYCICDAKTQQLMYWGGDDDVAGLPMIYKTYDAARKALDDTDKGKLIITPTYVLE